MENTPEPIGEIMSRLFTAKGWGRQQERLRLEQAWKQVAAEFISQTRVASLKRGVLEIEVRSSILLQELSQFHKRRLIKDLRIQLKGVSISDLRFRTAVWE